MRILVTGGAGFIGSNLCHNLTSGDTADRVVVLDNLSTGLESSLSGLDVDLHVGDIRELGLVIRATRNCDAVVHLAARGSVGRSVADPVTTHEINAGGTLNVLEACREAGVEHVIVASSSSVYGHSSEVRRAESSAPKPSSPYAASKLACESYASAYAKSYGMNCLVLRFFNVFGPQQRYDIDHAAVIPAFISQAIAGQPVTIEGSGEHRRDFTYVDKVVDVIAIALKRRIVHDSPVNVGNGRSISVLELVSSLEQIMEMRVSRLHEPGRVGDVAASCADTRLLDELFRESKLRVGRFEDELQDTVHWISRRVNGR